MPFKLFQRLDISAAVSSAEFVTAFMAKFSAAYYNRVTSRTSTHINHSLITAGCIYRIENNIVLFAVQSQSVTIFRIHPQTIVDGKGTSAFCYFAQLAKNFGVGIFEADRTIAVSFVIIIQLFSDFRKLNFSICDYSVIGSYSL